ncbi:metallophosphoesterase [Algoriphagus sp. CAU 1675]|uniref:metallophosphoesterase family protein n=1 Tax=Algoriphagus sp. CAU 1675 TaxID=3032597 RepID=UPI0023DBD150|nr:metallophosphoesterase [Algoriphagus sp. CAU 1675]MDF2157260.1 metallophosphoesterase [Algoriphagus sp. CAU 1675]
MRTFWIGCCALLLIQACQPKSTSPTFGEVFFSDGFQIGEYLDDGFSGENLFLLDSGWRYLGSDSIPGIEREFPGVMDTGEHILLPHRLSLPNHSMWYHWEGFLDQGVLIVDADDGVQVWLDGERVKRSPERELFEVKGAGKRSLILRVVNNAMAGGLRKIHWMKEENYWKWKNSLQVRRDSVLTRRKLDLLEDESLKDQLEKLSFEERGEILKSYPIVFTSPLLLLGTDGIPFLRWVSEQGGEARLVFQGGKEVKVQSQDGIFNYDLSKESSLSFELFQGKSHQGSFEFELPVAKDSVKIAIWGDSQGGWETFRKISEEIEKHQVDLSVGAGDLVNNGSEELAYPRLLQVLGEMKTLQLLVPGNHDYDGFYEDLKPKPMHAYLFKEKQKTYGLQFFGPLAVMTLDPNTFFPVSLPEGSEQREWMDKQLNSEKWASSPWKMVVLHQPPYSQGWPDYHGEESIRELLEPYFHKGLIDIVQAGHTHDYERWTGEFSGNRVHFLIVGGAGGGLEKEGMSSAYPEMDLLVKKHHYGIMNLKEDAIQLQVFGLGGEVLDEFRINKK